MKTQYFLIILLIGLSSCSDFLEVIPKNKITDQTLFSEIKTADLFLNNIYADLPDIYNMEDPEEFWSDNAMNSISNQPSRTVYANSIYGPNESPQGMFSYSDLYATIRKSNLFIESVNKSDLEQDWKVKRLGEARFLRAYFYMQLWTHYGGVPIITDVLNQNTQGEEIFRNRNSAEETFRFIVDECVDIVNDLPLKEEEPGRVTKGAVLALKGWCELFWASPLYNTANDKTRWTNASSTYKNIIDLGLYELFSDYETMFYEDNNNNKEVIFDRQYLKGSSLGGSSSGLWGPYFADGTRSHAYFNPTQELVDEYCMANGLPISDPESGYNPQSPYSSREKRFYQSIIYDGSEWRGVEIKMKQGIGSPNATDLTDKDNAPNTGYYLRKTLDPEYAYLGWQYLNSANFIIYRYAEVLLSYAEAQNEAVGPDESVYNAVNQVRERSELPQLEEGITQEEMRMAISRERRVELAFEQKRWCDLIRLKIAEDKLNGPIHGMLIEQENGEWVHKVIEAAGGMRIFYPEKNYFLPIPHDVIARNPDKMSQNPNYR